MCAGNRAECASRLLQVTANFDARAKADAKDIDGNTASHVAAQAGHEETVLALARCLAVCHVQNDAGLTPAELAEQAGHPRLVPIFCGIED